MLTLAFDTATETATCALVSDGDVLGERRTTAVALLRDVEDIVARTDVVPADADRRTAKALATKAIMGRIAALLDPRHRGVYADAVHVEPPSEPAAAS